MSSNRPGCRFHAMNVEESKTCARWRPGQNMVSETFTNDVEPQKSRVNTALRTFPTSRSCRIWGWPQPSENHGLCILFLAVDVSEAHSGGNFAHNKGPPTGGQWAFIAKVFLTSCVSLQHQQVRVVQSPGGAAFPARELTCPGRRGWHWKN